MTDAITKEQTRIKPIPRLASIDTFRALTMFLMIFVNDVEGVRNIPHWIKHVTVAQSGLGFADVIFPAFLFIVGLSIPLAIQSRINKGYSQAILIRDISLRAVALIVMGLFQVNFAYYNEDLALLPRSVFILLTTGSFFLVWLAYGPEVSRARQRTLRIVGVLLLLGLASIYRSGTIDSPAWMNWYWWGILGLIGWAYGLVALIYVFMPKKISGLIVVFLLLSLIQIPIHLQLFSLPEIIVGDTAHAVLVAGGVLCSSYFLKNNAKTTLPWVICLLVGVFWVGLGLAIADWTDGLNKIRATPGWVHLTMGISLVSYSLLGYVTEVKNKTRLLYWISAAGTSTLTCYLLPYIWYACQQLTGWHWPAFFQEGPAGIIRSFVFAILIVQMAAWLEKRRIKIKV